MTLAGAFALVLCVLFLWASASKVLRWSTWRVALRGYGLSGAFEGAVAFAVPAAEAGVALLLASGRASIGGAVALALISLFSLAVLRARAVGGDDVPCGCFGRAGARDYRALLGRNLLLAVLAGALLIAADGEAARASVHGRDAIPVLLTLCGVALAGWLVRAASASLRGRGRG